ncbi:hypothetical protein C7E18_24340, partial [Stenotrophomonas maltophilia]
ALQWQLTPPAPAPPVRASHHQQFGGTGAGDEGPAGPTALQWQLTPPAPAPPVRASHHQQFGGTGAGDEG